MTLRLAMLVLSASTLSAQAPLSLGGRTGALNDGFTYVIGMAEIADGRVVISDFRAKQLYIGDFKTGVVTPLGRTGDGPGEYQLLQGLFPVAGDTLEMVDFPSRRTLRIGPNGAIAGSRTFELSSTPLADESKVGNRLSGGPQFIDRKGVFYSMVQYLEMGKGVVANGSYILASDPVTNTRRRAAPFQSWYPEHSTRWRAPFLYADLWAAGSDGRIARVVPTDYHVEWYRDNTLLAKGPATSFDRVKVTKADRDEWFAAKYAQGPSGAGVSNSPAQPAAPPSGARPTFQPFTDADFPEFKPPYVEEFNGRAATVSLTGELWVNRVTPLGVKAPVADVFDATGKRVRTIALPPSTRVAGFGKSSLYLIRTDDDGMQWLERYPLR